MWRRMVGTFATTVPSLHFTMYLQRRGGLHLSAAKGVMDADEAEGGDLNRLGDELANKAEHSSRHHRVLRPRHLRHDLCRGNR